MKALEYSKKRAFSIIVRLFIIVLSAICFHGLRYLLLVIGLIFLLVDLLRQIQPHRHRRMLLTLDCVIVIWLISMYWLSHPIENLRFQFLNRQYDSAVEELLPVLADAEDTTWSTYKMEKVLPLSVKNEVVYQKRGDSIAIYFSTFCSFSTDSGFIWFSDETARDFFEHPSEYDQSLSAEPAYDYIEPYNTNWAYITLYY